MKIEFFFFFSQKDFIKLVVMQKPRLNKWSSFILVFIYLCVCMYTWWYNQTLHAQARKRYKRFNNYRMFSPFVSDYCWIPRMWLFNVNGFFFFCFNDDSFCIFMRSKKRINFYDLKKNTTFWSEFYYYSLFQRMTWIVLPIVLTSPVLLVSLQHHSNLQILLYLWMNFDKRDFCILVELTAYKIMEKHLRQVHPV